MENGLLVAILSCVGTIIGSLSGILATAKMTAFRLAQLEKKVERHNTLVERMVAVEQSSKSAHRRIDDIMKLD